MMLTPQQIEHTNQVLLLGLSSLLNERPDFMDAQGMAELTGDGSLREEDAYALVLAAVLGLEVDRNRLHREIFEAYFPEMLHALSAEDYRNNPFYQTVGIREGGLGKWRLCRQQYAPYEAFAAGDFLWKPDGRLIPQIGYFDEAFEYLAVLEDGREWMLITPNEIITMEPAVRAAYGKVLTYGLGLGYYAFMAARKDEVESVTVVERDAEAIALFERYILPQFGKVGEKIRIVHADAFDYAVREMGKGGYNYVFTDLWHDPSDGVELYHRMQELEKYSPGSEFAYWIEDTLRWYE